MKRITILGLAFSIACGGGTTAVQTTETTPEPTVTPEPPPADPWQAMTGDALREYVKAEALSKLAEVQPAATAEALEGWLADPSSAPALSGRAVERLFDLAGVALAGGELDRARRLVQLVRAKAANRNSAFAGNTLLVEIARRTAEPQAEATAEGAEGVAPAVEPIATVFRQLPRSRFGSATVIFQIFQEQAQLDAQLGQIHQQLVSLDTAGSALYFEQIFPQIVANRGDFLAAIEVVRQEHAAAPAQREYDFPTVDLSRDRRAQEVVVGVWDLGTNTELFSEQLFVNPNEQANGEDDDGNGLVDDIGGVVQDPALTDHTQLLYQPDAATLEEYTPFLRGIMDLRAGIADSEAAQRVLTLMRGATDPQQLEALDRNLDAIGEWAHGTHVAGIMLAGVPQARMAVFRSVWAGEARIYHHRGPTDEELAVERANVEAVAAFINTHNVRVVNASLGFSLEYVAGALRHERDAYQTDEQVMERAREIQAHRTASWNSVFEACPDTLFVVAAGNSNQDVVEYGVTPASSESTNVLVVGAVDRFGGWATFTNSNPDRVRIFDFGVEVPSLIPDGTTVPLSGTSMASPNVANLATKMVAVESTLTPQEIISIIEETGDAIAEPFNGRIANETAAIRSARRAARRR